MNDHPELLATVENRVGTLVLNRPERRNALSPDLLIRLHLQLTAWAVDDSVRAVVIHGGEGKAFSSGYDILAFPTNVTPETAALLKEHNPLELALSSVRDFPCPVIAMLNGYCFGAGLNLAMCCDIRIAADDIKAGMPPAKLGLVYHPEGLRQFIEVIGMARTRELFFTGRTYEGLDVKEMGLADRLVRRERLRETVYAMAAEIASNAPLSLKGMKRIMNMLGRRWALSQEENGEAEALIQKGFASEDLKEGQTAFIEKRKPVFRGK